MFGDVGQARTKAAMLLMLIATTSSRICTKPIVVRLWLNIQNEAIIINRPFCRFFKPFWIILLCFEYLPKRLFSTKLH